MPVSASAAEGEQKRQREYVLKALLATQLLLYHEFESRGEIVRRIPFAHADLYLIQGRACLGEITFFPWSGYMEYEPGSFDFKLGKHFILSDRRARHSSDDVKGTKEYN